MMTRRSASESRTETRASERASAAAAHLPAVMPSVGVSTRSRLILTVYAAVLGERASREGGTERERGENVSRRTARMRACAGRGIERDRAGTHCAA